MKKIYIPILIAMMLAPCLSFAAETFQKPSTRNWYRLVTRYNGDGVRTGPSYGKTACSTFSTWMLTPACSGRLRR